MIPSNFIPADKTSRILSLFFLLLSVAIPFGSTFFLAPLAMDFFVSRTEREALLRSRFLAEHISIGESLTTESLRSFADSETVGNPWSFRAMKIAIHDPSGKVLHSTNPRDIGETIVPDSFQTIIAKGGAVSRFTGEKERHVEEPSFRHDVVETIIPIVQDGFLQGALAAYYDVTEQSRAVRRILLIATVLPTGAMLLLLFFFLRSRYRLDQSLKRQEESEKKIQDQYAALLKEQEKQTDLLKRIERAKKQWERTMDCVGDIIIIADTTAHIERCNMAFMEFAGMGYGDILGRRWPEFFEEKGLEPAEFHGDGCEYHHGPSDRWFYLKLYPYEEQDRQMLGVVLVLHDFTERKRISRELEKKKEEIEVQRNKLQFALDEVSSLIQQVLDENHMEVYFENPVLKKCWEEMRCGKEACPCYGKEPVRCWQVTGTFCKGKAQGHFIQKYGSCMHCDFYRKSTADPIHNIGEQFNNMMFLVGMKNKELEDAYSELKAAQAQLLQREKMASIGQLAAGVAHEINNPVGFISSNLNSLGKYMNRLAEHIEELTRIIDSVAAGGMGLKAREMRRRLKLDFILQDSGDLVQESIEGCDRVRKIVHNLKTFSRVDQAELQAADVNECLDSTIHIVWNELKYKVSLKKDYGEIPRIECYPQQLNQVFMNLLVNASHAIEERGEIVVRTWHEEDAILIAISDNGCGIAPEHLNRIFDPFFTTKAVGKGTGLGLSIVYDIIVKNHKGTITVDSEIGKGSTFTIRLPMAVSGQ